MCIRDRLSIITPRYLNCLTCSIFTPLISIFIIFSLITITFGLVLFIFIPFSWRTTFHIFKLPYNTLSLVPISTTSSAKAPSATSILRKFLYPTCIFLTFSEHLLIMSSIYKLKVSIFYKI